MKKLRISSELSLPPDTVTSTMIVYGGKGMGKTVFGAVVAEELYAVGHRWSWLDPLGVSHGLRFNSAGTGKGIKCLILGGVHGDIPIFPDGGAAVADVVVEEGCNVLVDFSRSKTGEMWGVAEKIRFCAAYARRLFQRQGDIVGGRRRRPIMQFLDEAARYIPQNIPAGSPHLAECVSAWQQLVEEGRNVALGACLLTQRSARVNKDVAELADAMVAFRTVGPNSLRAVLDWLGEHVEKERHKELSSIVRRLPRGSALIVSPGWLDVEQVVPIRMRRTFDSSATPKPGQRARTTKGSGAKPDLKAIQARMAATIERAKADDPKELRKRIAELEKQARDGERAFKLSEELRTQVVETREVPVPIDWKWLRSEVAAGIASLDKRISDALVDSEVLHAQKGKRRSAKQSTQFERPPAKVAAKTRGVLKENGADARSNGAGTNGAVRPHSGDLPKGERTVLTAIAQHRDGVTREQLTVLTGYKRSTRNLYLQHIAAAGLIEEHGDRICATPSGVARLGDFEPLPTGRALLEYWLRELPSGESKILSIVSERHPDQVDRGFLDEVTGFKRSTRNLYLQHLVARRLIVGSRNGAVELAQELIG
jgi:hypothetical protein